MHMVAKNAKKQGAFKPIDVVGALDPGWLDESTCRMWILRQLHQRGACCPGCGTPITPRQRVPFSEFNRIACGSCGKYYNAFSNTFLSGVQGDLRKLVLMAYLIGLGLSDSAIAGHLGVARSSVWRFRKKFEDTDA